jgi:hypothetical protein
MLLLVVVVCRAWGVCLELTAKAQASAVSFFAANMLLSKTRTEWRSLPKQHQQQQQQQQKQVDAATAAAALIQRLDSDPFCFSLRLWPTPVLPATATASIGAHAASMGLTRQTVYHAMTTILQALLASQIHMETSVVRRFALAMASAAALEGPGAVTPFLQSAVAVASGAPSRPVLLVALELLSALGQEAVARPHANQALAVAAVRAQLPPILRLLELVATGRTMDTQTACDVPISPGLLQSISLIPLAASEALEVAGTLTGPAGVSLSILQRMRPGLFTATLASLSNQRTGSDSSPGSSAAATAGHQREKAGTGAGALEPIDPTQYDRTVTLLGDALAENARELATALVSIGSRASHSTASSSGASAESDAMAADAAEVRAAIECLTTSPSASRLLTAAGKDKGTGSGTAAAATGEPSTSGGLGFHSAASASSPASCAGEAVLSRRDFVRYSALALASLGVALANRAAPVYALRAAWFQRRSDREASRAAAALDRRRAKAKRLLNGSNGAGAAAGTSSTSAVDGNDSDGGCSEEDEDEEAEDTEAANFTEEDDSVVVRGIVSLAAALATAAPCLVMTQGASICSGNGSGPFAASSFFFPGAAATDTAAAFQPHQGLGACLAGASDAVLSILVAASASTSGHLLSAREAATEAWTALTSVPASQRPAAYGAPLFQRALEALLCGVRFPVGFPCGFGVSEPWVAFVEDGTGLVDEADFGRYREHVVGPALEACFQELGTGFVTYLDSLLQSSHKEWQVSISDLQFQGLVPASATLSSGSGTSSLLGSASAAGSLVAVGNRGIVQPDLWWLIPESVLFTLRAVAGPLKTRLRDVTAGARDEAAAAEHAAITAFLTNLFSAVAAAGHNMATIIAATHGGANAQASGGSAGGGNTSPSTALAAASAVDPVLFVNEFFACSPQMMEAGVRAIGSFAQWIAGRTPLIDGCLLYTLGALRVPGVAGFAAQTLQQLAMRCSARLSSTHGLATLLLSFRGASASNSLSAADTCAAAGAVMRAVAGAGSYQDAAGATLELLSAATPSLQAAVSDLRIKAMATALSKAAAEAADDGEFGFGGDFFGPGDDDSSGSGAKKSRGGVDPAAMAEYKRIEEAVVGDLGVAAVIIGACDFKAPLPPMAAASASPAALAAALPTSAPPAVACLSTIWNSLTQLPVIFSASEPVLSAVCVLFSSAFQALRATADHLAADLGLIAASTGPGATAAADPAVLSAASACILTPVREMLSFLFRLLPHMPMGPILDALSAAVEHFGALSALAPTAATTASLPAAVASAASAGVGPSNRLLELAALDEPMWAAVFSNACYHPFAALFRFHKAAREQPQQQEEAAGGSKPSTDEQAVLANAKLFTALFHLSTSLLFFRPSTLFLLSESAAQQLVSGGSPDILASARAYSDGEPTVRPNDPLIVVKLIELALVALRTSSQEPDLARSACTFLARIFSFAHVAGAVQQQQAQQQQSLSAAARITVRTLVASYRLVAPVFLHRRVEQSIGTDAVAGKVVSQLLETVLDVPPEEVQDLMVESFHSIATAFPVVAKPVVSSFCTGYLPLLEGTDGHPLLQHAQQGQWVAALLSSIPDQPSLASGTASQQQCSALLARFISICKGIHPPSALC